MPASTSSFVKTVEADFSLARDHHHSTVTTTVIGKGATGGSRSDQIESAATVETSSGDCFGTVTGFAAAAAEVTTTSSRTGRS